jgi:long-chain acyl-CoA synthetase
MGNTTGYATVCEAFAATTARYADRIALHSADATTTWTWREYADRVRAAAGGLANLGVRRGDSIALWLTNRPEFHAADIGAIMLGAVTVSIYATFTVAQAEHVVSDAGSHVLVTEQQFLERALELLRRKSTALQTVIVVDGNHADALTWDDLLAQAPADVDLEAAAGQVSADDLVTLIYTSGTTGPPKGVELTHRNVMAQAALAGRALGLQDSMSAISWLPMAHMGERMCTHYLALTLGWSVTCLADASRIAEVLVQTRPQFFLSPPRLWEKLRSAAILRLGAVPDGPTVLAALGLDQTQLAVTSAAPSSPTVIEFWRACGLPLCEAYGMSETTGVVTVNRPDAVRIGTTGVALPDVEVRLSDAGEILIRGPIVMRGYRNLPEATAAAIDADGWMHSGDVGEVDDDGYLRVADRIKELIINAAGKNMSPANIEATIKSASPLIGNVCCIGNGRPYNVALVTVDAETAAAFSASAEGTGQIEAAANAQLHAAIEAAVARANGHLSRVEQIKRFTVLTDDWAPGGDELTPTMKLKRAQIAKKYAAEISALYRG